MLNTEASAGAYKHKGRHNPGIGGAQRLRERQEHRPFCFRAFAANSTREAERQKGKHQTWRSYESFAKVVRKGPVQALEPAWADASPVASRLGDIRLRLSLLGDLVSKSVKLK